MSNYPYWGVFQTKMSKLTCYSESESDLGYKNMIFFKILFEIVKIGGIGHAESNRSISNKIGLRPTEIDRNRASFRTFARS